MTDKNSSQTNSSGRSRSWVFGGAVLVIVVLCLACVVFGVIQYKTSLSAYAWIRAANNATLDKPLDAICEGSQAALFTTAFVERYGKEVEISLSGLEEGDNQVLVKGNISVKGQRSKAYEATFYTGEKSMGFLGTLRCIERIEQVSPDPLPSVNFGG